MLLIGPVVSVIVCWIQIHLHRSFIEHWLLFKFNQTSCNNCVSIEIIENKNINYVKINWMSHLDRRSIIAVFLIESKLILK